MRNASMMKESAKRKARWRSWLVLAMSLIIVVLISAIWYRYHYAMEVARSFEVAGSPTGPRVLIATQGSDFKDALTAGLVDHLKRRSASVKVIDVTELEGIQEADWNAMVVIHTWEMRKPPIEVRAFVDRMRGRDKLVVLTTSGAGHFKLEGVDAISAASQMEDVTTRVSEVGSKIDAILDAQSRGAEAEEGRHER
jgi:hypothetical protein